MKFKLYTVKKECYEVDIDPELDVIEMKKMLKENYNFKDENFKILCQGKILSNDKKISSYNLNEESKLTLFIPQTISSTNTLPGTTTSPATTPTMADTGSTAEATLQPGNLSAGTGPVGGQPLDPVNQNIPEPEGNQQQFVQQIMQQNALTPEKQEMINNLAEMGYDAKDAERALRAAYWDVNRAVEYLLTGIPANLENEMNEDAYLNQMIRQGGGGTGAQGTGTPNYPSASQGLRMPGQSGSLGYGSQPQPQVGSQPLQQPSQPLQQPMQQPTQQPMMQQPNLMQQPLFTQPQPNLQLSPEMQSLELNPQFQMIKVAVQQNPASLQFYLEQIRQNNPNMFNLINAHQQEFIAMLNAPILNQPMQQQPQQPMQPQFTAADDESILQLMGITGFEREKCVKGYLVCGRNMELAASYMLENPNFDTEDLEEGGQQGQGDNPDQGDQGQGGN